MCGIMCCWTRGVHPLFCNTRRWFLHRLPLTDNQISNHGGHFWRQSLCPLFLVSSTIPGSVFPNASLLRSGCRKTPLRWVAIGFGAELGGRMVAILLNVCRVSTVRPCNLRHRSPLCAIVFKSSPIWSPRGGVLRCLIDDTLEHEEREPVIQIDDKELTWSEFVVFLFDKCDHQTLPGYLPESGVCAVHEVVIARHYFSLRNELRESGLRWAMLL